MTFNPTKATKITRCVFLCIAFVAFLGLSLGAKADSFGNLDDALEYFINNKIEPSCAGYKVYNIVSGENREIISTLTASDREPSNNNEGIFRDFRPYSDTQIRGYLSAYYNDLEDIKENTTYNNDSFKHKIDDSTIHTDDYGRYLLISHESQMDVKLECVSGCSRAPHPMSSLVLECIEGTINRFFVSSDPDEVTVFQTIQSVFSPIIILLVVLYIVFVGFATLMGDGWSDTNEIKQDIVMVAIKIALVSYFALGDGWKDFFYQALKSIPAAGSQIILEAGIGNDGNVDGCVMPYRLYPDNKPYLALFDAVDCKIGNYVGYFPDKLIPGVAEIAFAYSLFPVPVLITMMCVAYFVILALLAAKIVQTYISIVFEMGILLFISPIILPLALFNIGKKYKKTSVFNNWLNKLQGTLLPPIGIFLSVTIILVITDDIFYGKNPEDANPPIFVYDSVDDKTEWGNAEHDFEDTTYSNSTVRDCASFQTDKEKKDCFSEKDPNHYITGSAVYKNCMVQKSYMFEKSVTESLGPISGFEKDDNPGHDVDNAEKYYCFQATYMSFELSQALDPRPKNINPECDHGMRYSDIKNFFGNFDASIVCFIANFSGRNVVELPIPKILVIVSLPLPVNLSELPLLLLILLKAIFYLLGLGFVLDRMDGAVKQVFGGTDLEAGGKIDPRKTGMKMGMSAATSSGSKVKEGVSAINRARGGSGHSDSSEPTKEDDKKEDEGNKDGK